MSELLWHGHPNSRNAARMTEMTRPIIDTTRSVTFESQIVEIGGVDRTIWNIVVNCPVDGIYLASCEYFGSREEAEAAWIALAA